MARKENQKTKKTTEEQVIGFQEIKIPPLELQVMSFNLISDSALIQNCFSKRISEEMERLNNLTPAERKKETRRPVSPEEVKQRRDGTLHWFNEKGDIGFPAVAFKAAMITTIGALNIPLHMTKARKLLFVLPDDNHFDLVKLDVANIVEYSIPARLKNGSMMVRHRYMIKSWGVRNLRVQFNPHNIKPEQVALLISHAGFVNGIGDWRPGSRESNTGTFGRWHVEGKKGEYDRWMKKHGIKG